MANSTVKASKDALVAMTAISRYAACTIWTQAG